MTMPQDTVFLLDVDNTLLDNDKVIADLRQHLEQQFGNASAERYWAIFEALRGELGYADYLGALQRYRVDSELGLDGDPRLLEMAGFLIDYPFAEALYPGSLAVIQHLNAFGPTVILSDGDAVFQAVRRLDGRENYTLYVVRRIGHALVVALILERDVSPTLTKKLIQRFFNLLNIDRKFLGRVVIELRPNEGVTSRSASSCQRG